MEKNFKDFIKGVERTSLYSIKKGDLFYDPIRCTLYKYLFDGGTASFDDGGRYTRIYVEDIAYSGRTLFYHGYGNDTVDKFKSMANKHAIFLYRNMLESYIEKVIRLIKDKAVKFRLFKNFGFSSSFEYNSSRTLLSISHHIPHGSYIHLTSDNFYFGSFFSGTLRQRKYFFTIVEKCRKELAFFQLKGSKAASHLLQTFGGKFDEFREKEEKTL